MTDFPPPSDPSQGTPQSPQQPYGAGPGVGMPGQQMYFQPSVEHPKAVTVLVLGCLSVVLCQILGPVAWVYGNRVRSEMRARPDINWGNEGLVTAGWVLGIVATALLVVSVLALIAFLGIAIAAAGASAT